MPSLMLRKFLLIPIQANCCSQPVFLWIGSHYVEFCLSSYARHAPANSANGRKQLCCKH